MNRKLLFSVVKIQLFVLIISILPNISFASPDTLFASYKYVMGDNDSKADARNLCFLNAKKLCLEKAGTYVSSELSVLKTEHIQNNSSDYSEVSNQEISTYTGAFIKVDVIDEKFALDNGVMSVSMSVRAIVDPKSVLDQIVAVKQNDELSKKIREQQEQLAAMEKRLGEIQESMEKQTPDLTKPAREERVEVFSKMSELERIKYDIELKTQKAMDYVELGMTPDEVVRLIGSPRSSTEPCFYNSGCYNYGNVWVVFESGVVSCIVKAEYFNAAGNGNGRRDYESNQLVK